MNIAEEIARQSSKEMGEMESSHKDVYIGLLQDSVIDVRDSRKEDKKIINRLIGLLCFMFILFLAFATYSQYKLTSILSCYDFETFVVEQDIDAFENVKNSANIEYPEIIDAVD